MIGSAGPDGSKPSASRELHALGPLEEEEVAQRPLAEGHEGELHARRVALGLVGHVRAGDVRRRADGGEEVVDERPVQHLLGGDGEDDRAPPFDRVEVLGSERLVGFGLDAEGGVEVLAHQPVLELRRLAEQVRQRLAVLDDDGWFRRHCRAKLAIRVASSSGRSVGGRTRRAVQTGRR